MSANTETNSTAMRLNQKWLVSRYTNFMIRIRDRLRLRVP